VVTGVAQVDLAALQVWVVVVVAAVADLAMMTTKTKTKIKSGKTGLPEGREGNQRMTLET
jgi:hypothetical protein